MINALIITLFTRKHPELLTTFEVSGTACTTLEEAREEVERDNDEEQDINNKLIAYLPIDHADAGLHAFAALLALAVEADHNVQGVGIEDLLAKVFMAGKTPV